MLKVFKILVIMHALAGVAAMLGACGQKGPLYLPSTPESTGRATLPETLKPWSRKTAPPTATTPALTLPNTGSAAPVAPPPSNTP